MQYGWDNCPDETRTQVESFVRLCREAFDEQLVGIYLHGSLAMGCFNPARSDIDLLTVIGTPMSQLARRRLAEGMLQLSMQPHPLEVSVLTLGQLHPWQYPTPFEYHFSEGWRDKQEADTPATDADLAAHIVIARERGVCLYGDSARSTLPHVPVDDYVDALLYDFDSAVQDITSIPVYGVLNLCRVYWYLAKGAICSKDEAGVWAMDYLPEAFYDTVLNALQAYRLTDAELRFDEAQLTTFAAYIDDRVRELLS